MSTWKAPEWLANAIVGSAVYGMSTWRWLHNTPIQLPREAKPRPRRRTFMQWVSELAGRWLDGPEMDQARIQAELEREARETNEFIRHVDSLRNEGETRRYDYTRTK